MRTAVYSLSLALAGLAVIFTCSGCMSTQTVSPLTERMDSLGISIRGVRDVNIRLAYRDALTVEQAADSIIALASDRGIRLNAYLWKIYCIPVIRYVYAQSDPIASSVDALVFSMQCNEYVTTGLGKDRFGPYQQIAIRATDENLERIIEVNRQRLTSTNLDSLLAQTSRWTNGHLLDNHVFERTSIILDLDAILSQRDYSIGSAVGRIADDVDDLSERLSLLSAQLPREARWQGEMIIHELSLRERLDHLDTLMTVLAASLTGLQDDLQNGTIMIDIASLRALHSDLASAFSLIQAERAVVVGEIERMRLSTIAASELAAVRTVDNALERTEGIVNRVLLKVGLALGVVCVFVAVMVLINRSSRRRTG
jgi:hypothetical protein